MRNILDVIDKYKDRLPVPIEDIICDMGVELDLIPLSDDISGWIEKKADGRYHIAVNRNHARTRQRFTMAHELAHFVYHRSLIGDGVGDTRAYRASGSTKPNAKVRPRHERQANSVAANILMPREAIERLQAAGKTDPAELAKLFDVSESAMRIRLGLPYTPSMWPPHPGFEGMA